MIGKPSARATAASVAAYAEAHWPGAPVVSSDVVAVVDGLAREAREGRGLRLAGLTARAFLAVLLAVAFVSGMVTAALSHPTAWDDWRTALLAGLSGGAGFLAWEAAKSWLDLLGDDDAKAAFVDLARDAIVLPRDECVFLSVEGGVVRATTLSESDVLDARVTEVRGGRVDASVTAVDGTLREVRLARRDGPAIAAFLALAARCRGKRMALAA